METGEGSVLSGPSKPERRPQPVYPGLSCSIDVAAQLPPGFRALARNNRLSLKVLEALQRARRLQGEAALENLTKPSFWGSKNLQTTQPFHSDFWEACPSLNILDFGEADIDRILCLGLFLHSVMAFSCLSIHDTMLLWSSMFQWMRKELTHCLHECQEEREEAEEKCLFWIWNVAVNSWRKSPTGLKIQGHDLLSAGRRRFGVLLNIQESRDVLALFFECSKIADFF